VVKYLTKRRSS